MKNTITLNCTDFLCECLDSVDDGTNRIFIAITVGNKTNPTLVIRQDNLTVSTVNLSSNSENIVLIPVEYYKEDITLSIQFVSNESSSSQLYFIFPSNITGNMTLKRDNDTSYQASYPQPSENILLQVYPVGSIYMSVNTANPGNLFGGTWESWGTGKVPVGVDASDVNFNSVEKTGGKKTHTLSTSEIPTHNHGAGTLTTKSAGSHTHKLKYTGSETSSGTAHGWINADGTSNLSNAMTSAGAHTHTISGNTDDTGKGSAHNNLQPYITCYMWKRVA